MGRVSLIAALASFACQAGGAVEPPTPTFEEVTRGLDRAESALRSIEVDCEFDILMEAARAPGGYVKLTARVHALVERAGRFRFSETGTGFNYNHPAQTHPSQAVGAFDGSTLRQMAGAAVYSQGLVSAKPSDAQWRFDPRRALYQFYGKTVAAWLRDGKGRIVGIGNVNGVRAVAVETEPVIKDGIEWKERFVVAPEKNYAVLRRALLKRYVEEKAWFEYSHVITSEYKEHGDGVWLPGRVLYESFNIKKEVALGGEKEFPISWRYEGTMANWRVNRPLSDAEFRLEFEPRLFINDRITGRSYQYDAETDKGESKR